MQRRVSPSSALAQDGRPKFRSTLLKPSPNLNWRATTTGDAPRTSLGQREQAANRVYEYLLSICQDQPLSDLAAFFDLFLVDQAWRGTLPPKGAVNLPSPSTRTDCMDLGDMRASRCRIRFSLAISSILARIWQVDALTFGTKPRKPARWLFRVVRRLIAGRD